MKKFNYGAKGWGIVIFCFFLFWVGSGCPVTSLNVIMSEYNAMYGWDIAVLNGLEQWQTFYQLLQQLYLAGGVKNADQNH
ncbi:MAG: hypothetical protein ACLUD0_02405 [Eubacterium ramulus]